MPLITMVNDNNDVDAQIDNLCEVRKRAPPPRRRAQSFPEPDTAGAYRRAPPP